MFYYNEGKTNVWWNSEVDITDWSLTGTGVIDLKEKFEMNELWGYGFIKQAHECYSAARCLELSFSIDPKDKLLDEMCIRHLRRTAEALFLQGLSQLKLNRNIKDVTPEEDTASFKEAISGKSKP